MPIASLGSTARTVELGGAVSYSGTLASIKVRALLTISGAVAFVGAHSLTGLGRTVGAALSISGEVMRRWLRTPLRFARRKGIITRGVDR